MAGMGIGESQHSSPQEGWRVNCKMSGENMEKRRPQATKETTKARETLAERSWSKDALY